MVHTYRQTRQEVIEISRGCHRRRRSQHQGCHSSRANNSDRWRRHRRGGRVLHDYIEAGALSVGSCGLFLFLTAERGFFGACGGFEACASGFFKRELLGSFRGFGSGFSGGFSGSFSSGEGAEVGEIAAEGSFGFKLREKGGGWLVGVVKRSMTRESGHNVHLE